MKHRIAIASVATVAAVALIVGACADQDGGSRFSTEPGAARPMLGYITTSSAAVVNPKTKQLEAVKIAPSARGGPNASVEAGGSASALIVPANAPGIAKSALSSTITFVDDGGHKQAIVLLYRSTGGPPAAMQHYIDGALVSTTAYQWGKTSGGWLRTQSVMRSVSKGALVGTYTTTTVPGKPGSGGTPAEMVRNEGAPRVTPLDRVLGTVGYGLALALAPQDALAQAFSACRLEWLRFAAAAIILAATGSAMAGAPVITLPLLGSFLTSLTNAAGAEDILLDCIIRHSNFTGGGTATLPSGKWDCFDGSYSAHCTTAFTM